MNWKCFYCGSWEPCEHDDGDREEYGSDDE